MSNRWPSLREVQGFLPERTVPDESKLDRFVIGAAGNAVRRLRARPSRFRTIVPNAHGFGSAFQEVPDARLREAADRLRRELRTRGFSFDRVAETFALVREAAGRTVGMRHFDVQLIGGFVLFHGMVAEMETGEGKTLTATLPACAAALAGIPVHIITVNDYLARRDAEWMGPIYRALGLTVGIIVQGMSLADRRHAYRCDVAYCTNKEVVFDYLKDKLALGRRPGWIQMHAERLMGSSGRMDRLCQRGLCFAIVDEADSVLIDEARTPLIISGPGDNTYEKRIYQEALELAEALEPDEDYELDEARRTLTLTEAGKQYLEQLAEPLGGFWGARQRREELARQALSGILLFHKDKQYLVRSGKVQIVDEYTGRTMPDRFWEQGLHQLIETKECCEITTQNETLARISYQRFFRRYLTLAGMTGTAREVANEMWSVYRLPVVSVPTNKPMIRRGLPARVFRTEREKWSAVVDRIRDLREAGRPVLVGTRSVAASEHLGRLLDGEGLPHRILNARQDKEEADIISQAGQRGQITVATNMAGRGTDILLGSGVRELGGLHVIVTERHDARRIDRQLCGRCGRQGDPGTYEVVASLEDEILSAHLRMPFSAAGRSWTDADSAFGRWLGDRIATYAQRRAERKHFQVRRDLLNLDESLESALAFSGRGE